MSGDGSWRYTRSLKKGNAWRPNYSSENSSEHGSLKSTKYLLRQESRKSVTSMSSDFHFSTLKHLEHDHAVVLGGFGETSTDYTLSRNGTLPNGKVHDVTVEMNGHAETKFDSDAAKSGKEGHDNPAMSKSSSFDSVDRAIDEWKQTVKKENVVEDDLVNSQNEMMFCYDNKALDKDDGLIDLNTPVVAPVSPMKDLVDAAAKNEASNVNGADPEGATPTLKSSPVKEVKEIPAPIQYSEADVTSPIPVSKSNVTSPAPVAVVHPTKRLSVKEMKSMFEGTNNNQTNTLQPKKGTGTNGYLQNGLNNNKFHSLPRKLEKPSAHVQPQQVISLDRDADVAL